MPYISAKDDRREKLRNGEPALTAGELNYQIFYYVKHQAPSLNSERVYYTIKSFVNDFLGEKPNYQRYNDMTGALIRCGKEIERRLGNGRSLMIKQELLDIMESYDDEIAKYEDEKIIFNGDVE
jgi:hypothetical protein